MDTTKDPSSSETTTFTMKALSIGIGIGELKPSKASRKKLDTSEAPIPQGKVSSAPLREYKPRPSQAKSTRQSVALHARGAKLGMKVFGHLVDLSIVLISASLVMLAFGFLEGGSLKDQWLSFQDNLDFWFNQFSILEIILMTYVGMLVYWMIFRLVAGGTIGSSMAQPTMKVTSQPGLARNKQ